MTPATPRTFPATEAPLPSFGRLAASGAIAGLAAGALLTLLQQVDVVPLIRTAEAFEQGAQDAPPALFATIAANIVTATGLGMLLAAAMAMRGDRGWRRGLLWGAAGFLVFFVAPSIGMPPELPGTESAPLHDRQLYWIGTVAATGAGLWLAVFAKALGLRALGLLLVVAPQLLGAPEHGLHAAALPADLAHEFIRAAYFVNVLFWLALGALTGRLASR